MSRCVFDQSEVLDLNNDRSGRERQPTRPRILKAMGKVETEGRIEEGKREVDGS